MTTILETTVSQQMSPGTRETWFTWNGDNFELVGDRDNVLQVLNMVFGR